MTWHVPGTQRCHESLVGECATMVKPWATQQGRGCKGSGYTRHWDPVSWVDYEPFVRWLALESSGPCKE